MSFTLLYALAVALMFDAPLPPRCSVAWAVTSTKPPKQDVPPPPKKDTHPKKGVPAPTPLPFPVADGGAWLHKHSESLVCGNGGSAGRAGLGAVSHATTVAGAPVAPP